MSKRIPAVGLPPNAGALPPPNGYETQQGYAGDMLSGESPFEESGIDFRRYLAALIRYKWLVVAVTVVGSVLGFVATGMITPVYEAEARLLIETRDRAEARVGALRPTELFQSYASYIELLYSTDLVMRPVVESLRLYLQSTIPADSVALASLRVNDHLVPGRYRLVVDQNGKSFQFWREGVDEPVQQGVLGDSIGTDLGFEWAPLPEDFTAAQVVEFGVSYPRDVASRMGLGIRSKAEGGGNFLTLTIQGRNPQRITELLNAVSERFVRVAGDLKVEELRDEISFLAEQLDIAERDLRQKESALKQLQVQTITMPREDTPVAPGVQGTTGPAEDHFFNLKYAREGLSREIAEIRRILDSADDQGIAVGALTFIPSVQQDNDLMAALTELTEKRQELRLLRYDYTDEYPPIQALEQRIAVLERREVPLLARALISELIAQQSNVASQIDAVSRELRRIPTVALEEARLERDVSIASGLYTNLQSRYVERVLAAKSTSGDVKILDAATMPRTPVNGTQRQRLIFVAFVLSLGAGVLAAVFLDRIDPRLRYPEQVSHELGIPILGTVPHAPTRDRRVTEVDARPLVEAFRAIRLSLTHVYGTAGPVLITVSSPGADDGKTFVTANLALAFADLGQRTLVIDGDVRRGCLHSRLGGFRKPGLIDYLAGRTTREQIIQSTGYASVDLIASGTRMQNAPELLQSASMSALVARVRADYDVILIDSPPLAAGIDPMVLGTLAGNLLLVLRTGATDRELLEAKLDMLAPLPIRLLGAVLNGVKAKGAYRYYSYYYSYLPGYESTDEQETWMTTKQLEAGSASTAAKEVSSDSPSRDAGARHSEEDELTGEDFEGYRFEFTPVVSLDDVDVLDRSDFENFDPTIEVTDFAPDEQDRNAARGSGIPEAAESEAKSVLSAGGGFGEFGEDPTESPEAGEAERRAVHEVELDADLDVDPTEAVEPRSADAGGSSSTGPIHDIELEIALAAFEDEDSTGSMGRDGSQSAAEVGSGVVHDVELDAPEIEAVQSESSGGAEAAVEQAAAAEPVAAAEERETAPVEVSQRAATKTEAVEPVEAQSKGKPKRGKRTSRKRKSRAKTDSEGAFEGSTAAPESAVVNVDGEPQEGKSKKKRRSRKKRPETAGT